MNEKTKTALIRIVTYLAYPLIVWALIIWAVVAIAGCAPTKYVPLESVRTEYVDKDNAELLSLIKSLTEQVTQKDRRIDSLMQSRNERLVLNDKGDTLRHDRETVVYRSSHRESELERLVESQRDSMRDLRQQLAAVRTDSVPVPYPVEKQLTRWQQAKMDFGGFALGGIFIAVCIAVLWLIKKIKK